MPGVARLALHSLFFFLDNEIYLVICQEKPQFRVIFKILGIPSFKSSRIFQHGCSGKCLRFVAKYSVIGLESEYIVPGIGKSPTPTHHVSVSMLVLTPCVNFAVFSLSLFSPK